ncbi:MAG: YggS family pyridoxal phosphate-dependent enzyme [Propionibacteriales bacterium]|nr:YggS family pyridoxal phosphate-dependent enzyme [Propionibacteriales bacterium]
MTRRAEVAANLARLRERIERACAAVDRPADDVRTIVVTKTFPASDVRLLAELGVRDVGENRHQEAVAKHQECRDLDLRWHFVGAVQSNKAAAVASYADVVHSIDRPKLVAALDKGAHAADRRVGCLVQVSLDQATGTQQGRSGADPDRVGALAELVSRAGRLDLLGVMGVAPLDGDPDKAFARLADVAAQVRARFPAATAISAGMSGDLEAALGRGATHVRVGTAVLGARGAKG